MLVYGRHLCQCLDCGGLCRLSCKYTLICENSTHRYPETLGHLGFCLSSFALSQQVSGRWFWGIWLSILPSHLDNKAWELVVQFTSISFIEQIHRALFVSNLFLTAHQSKNTLCAQPVFFCVFAGTNALLCVCRNKCLGQSFLISSLLAGCLNWHWAFSFLCFFASSWKC